MGNLTASGLIDSRQGTHGEFNENSRATWEIVRALQAERNWSVLPDNMKHALYMIAHKMGRIVAGNPEEPDHWDDIAGYATLVSQRIAKDVPPINIRTDLYAALAVGWDCSREEAVRRALEITGQSKRHAAAPAAPVEPKTEAALMEKIDTAIDEAVAQVKSAADQKHL